MFAAPNYWEKRWCELVSAETSQLLPRWIFLREKQAAYCDSGEQGNFLMFLTGLSRTPCIHVTGLGHPEHPIPPLPRHPVRLAMRLELPHVAVQPGGEHLRPCCGDRGVPAARVRHGVCQGVSPVTTSHPQNTAAADRSWVLQGHEMKIQTIFEAFEHHQLGEDPSQLLAEIVTKLRKVTLPGGLI